MKFQTLYIAFALTAALSACSSSSDDMGDSQIGGGGPPAGGAGLPTGGGDGPTGGASGPTGGDSGPTGGGSGPTGGGSGPTGGGSGPTGGGSGPTGGGSGPTGGGSGPTGGDSGPTGGGDGPTGGGEGPTGGGEGPTGGGERPTGGGASFDDALSLLLSFGEDGENVLPASVDALPDSAEMSGYMALGPVDSPVIVIGDAMATADFSAGRLAGEADNLVEYMRSESCAISAEFCTGTARQDVDGSMDISGTITGTSFTFDTSGSLSLADIDGDGGEISVGVDVGGTGAFGTSDGNLMAVGNADGLFDVKWSGETETIEGFVSFWLVD